MQPTKPLCGRQESGGGALRASTRTTLRDLPTVVVATQQRDVAGVARLEQHQQREHLEAVVPSVNKVAHEDVAGVRHRAARVKQLEQVMELAVNVATDLH